jgi:hypothetical protein
MDETKTPRLTRRAVLQRGGLAALAVFAPLGCGDSTAPVVAVPVDGGDGAAKFLNDAELAALRALVDRLIPGPPEDLDPGALDAGCAEAIDALLGAFSVDPPRIYAGGPYSDRGGATQNDFAQFIPLDDYETLAWRLRIEGSQGRPEREFNGAVVGLQQIYREGLAALDAEAQTYGAERFDGDVQPRGYTDEQVENPDKPGLQDWLPDLPIAIPLERLLALTPLASYEGAQAVLQNGNGSLTRLTTGIAQVLAAAQERRHGS